MDRECGYRLFLEDRLLNSHVINNMTHDWIQYNDKLSIMLMVVIK